MHVYITYTVLHYSYYISYACTYLVQVSGGDGGGQAEDQSTGHQQLLSVCSMYVYMME